MDNFPEPSWQNIQSVLKDNGFVEIKFDENWYIFMQKGMSEFPNYIKLPDYVWKHHSSK